MDFLKIIDWKLVAVQAVCFLFLLWLLRKFLWRPTFKSLEERRDKIASELKGLEDAKADLARIKAEYGGHLAKIDEEAQARFKIMERRSEDQAREIRDKARKEADHIIEDTRKEIQFEFVKSRETLKDEITELVVKATEQMIQEKLTFPADRKIIENMLDELGKTNER